MRMDITDSKVTVYFRNKTYGFERLENDRLNSKDSNIPSEVLDEIESRGFFFRNYPTTFTWKFHDVMYTFDEVLQEIPDNIIQPNSKEHQSLYNLVAGDYGGIRVEITVGEDGLCRFTNLKNDLPIEGSIRNKSMMDHINENGRL